MQKKRPIFEKANNFEKNDFFLVHLKWKVKHYISQIQEKKIYKMKLMRSMVGINEFILPAVDNVAHTEQERLIRKY